PHARAGDREPVLRRRSWPGRRDAARKAELRPLADRRPVGDRPRAGGRRGNGDLGRARPGAVAANPREAAVAQEPAGRRIPLADARVIAERWGLTLGEHFEPGAASVLVQAAATEDGGGAVLKIQKPHRESEHEAAALELWDGDGAIRLLAIDPKPLAGEREFAIAPIVRSFELGHSRRDVLDRFDRLTSELGLDRDRARGWTIGQTIAWAFDSSHRATHIETARWLLEAS